MQELGDLNKDILSSLDVPDKNTCDFAEHTVANEESLGLILKEKISAFGQNSKLLTMSLVHMNVLQDMQIQGLFVGDKVKVEGGKLTITSPSHPALNREAYLFSEWRSEVAAQASAVLPPVVEPSHALLVEEAQEVAQPEPSPLDFQQVVDPPAPEPEPQLEPLVPSPVEIQKEVEVSAVEPGSTPEPSEPELTEDQQAAQAAAQAASERVEAKRQAAAKKGAWRKKRNR